MKNKISKTLVLGVIFIFLGVSFAPVMNAVSIKQIEKLKIYEKTDQNHTAYFYCFIDINGNGTFKWIPGIGTIIGGILNISIKGLFSMDVNTRKIIKIFDGCTLSGELYLVVTMWFIGTKSENNNNLVAHGFAFCAVATEQTPI